MASFCIWHPCVYFAEVKIIMAIMCTICVYVCVYIYVYIYIYIHMYIYIYISFARRGEDHHGDEPAGHARPGPSAALRLDTNDSSSNVVIQ